VVVPASFYNTPMRYGLQTLHLLLAVGPPVLAVLWFLSHSIVGMLGWAAIATLFAVWYAALLTSQAMDERTHGTDGW
jgi:hypothetical protein